VRWPWVRSQPDQPDALNKRDAEHTVAVELADGTVVWCTPEAAEQWDPNRWRADP
jgi:hypothetical protein